MVAVLAAIAEVLCIAGLTQQAIGSVAVDTTQAKAFPPIAAPAISVLKPLHGDEPLLDVALESFFLLDYPVFQLVFGVADPYDPALRVVAHLHERYPDIDIAITTGPSPAGRNRKVANLIAMLPAAKHDVLVISDADMHVAPDFLSSVIDILAKPRIGLVTTLYRGLPAHSTLTEQLGALQINHGFLPGAALARRLGRRDCFGATMALSRATLAQIGGFPALLDHLADDNVLGRRVRAIGLAIGLAPILPATTISEPRFAALWRHELRWARTIRALVPGAYFGMAVQFSLFWALLALILAGFATWAWIVLAAAAVARYAVARQLDRRLSATPGGPAPAGLARTAGPWLFLVRDCISAGIFVASFWSDTVEWRGHRLRADSGYARANNTGE